jgi:hypothetical protein
MLEDDIAANKAMGKHGADHILALQSKDGSNVRVITHCNTGSLATAGMTPPQHTLSCEVGLTLCAAIAGLAQATALRWV